MHALTFRYTEEFCVETHRRFRRQSREFLAIWVVLGLLLAFLLVMTIWELLREDWWFVPFGAAVLVFGLLSRGVFEWAIRRSCRLSPLCDQMVRIELRDDGLHTTANVASGSVAWSVFIKVVHFRDGFLLLQGQYACNWIPIRYLEDPDSIDDLESLLRQKVANHKIIEPTRMENAEDPGV